MNYKPPCNYHLAKYSSSGSGGGRADAAAAAANAARCGLRRTPPGDHGINELPPFPGSDSYALLLLF